MKCGTPLALLCFCVSQVELRPRMTDSTGRGIFNSISVVQMAVASRERQLFLSASLRKARSPSPAMPTSSMDSDFFAMGVRCVLEFQIEDTRNKFTVHLCDALQRRGINTYIDNLKLRKGQVTSPSLFRAIENSMFCIIVLSQKYASSSWCLKELVKILQSKACNTEPVLPIFYDVDPCDVRKQRGDFGKAFERLARDLKGRRMKGVKILRLAKNLKGWEDKVKVWRKALVQVSNISGWDSRNR